MGYDFHITRSLEWVDDVSIIVTTEQWLAVARSIEDLRPVSEQQVGDATLKFPEGWQAHAWFAHPLCPGQAGPIFHLSRGDIHFRGDDPATVSLALRIAERLGCRVYGEGGEEYTLDTIIGQEIPAGGFNPFTGEPIASPKYEGRIEVRDSELYLAVERRSLFGILKRQERVLLYFVAPPPAPPAELHRGKIWVRGDLSAEGTYGSDRSCKYVFYVLEVLSFEPAS